MKRLLTFHEPVVVWFYNCKDCGNPLPEDMREIGFCKTCWKPFTADHINNRGRVNRLALEADKRERELFQGRKIS